MESKSKAGEKLKMFIAEYGVPNYLTFDGSKEQTGKDTLFMKTCREHDIDYHISEPYNPRTNPAEGVIREVRKRWFRIMRQENVPHRLWDYGFRWVCEIMSRTSNTIHSLDGRTPMEHVTGDTPDISEYIDFRFYDFVWYKSNAGFDETELGRWLGVSHRIGPPLSFFILKKNCQVISCTTVQRVTNLERKLPDNVTMMTEFNAAVKEQLNDNNHVIGGNNIDNPHPWETLPAPDDPEYAVELAAAIDNPTIKNADDSFTPDTYDDTYLQMEITLPQGDNDARLGRVTKRLRDANGLPIGIANENPMLDTRYYEVEFSDGSKQALAANIIAESMTAQIDDEGMRHAMIRDIVNHRSNQQAVKEQDSFVTTSASGARRRRETTKGWELLIEWKDGESNWVALKDMKAGYPIQTAEYAVANRIAEEPAFAWWVPDVFRKRDWIISKVKSKYWTRTHKFGFKIPKTVEEAWRIDAENGNQLWREAIHKEMINVRPAFEVWEKSEADLPIGYQKIRCHMIFDIKMAENFRRKARFVAGGHTTETPTALTYASVVSRDSVRIALLLAGLNELQILACDIQNAYLTADCREKIYSVAGPEFGSEAGSLMVIRKALYGLKSSGAAFRALLAETLYDLGYAATKADPDVYLRKAVKPITQTSLIPDYYEMLLVYVDDILCISHAASDTMKGIQERFKLKDDKVDPPDIYLGAKLEYKLMNNIYCWTMSAEKYVQSAVKNIEEALKGQNLRLPSRCGTPLTSNYRPEMDVSPELTVDGIQTFQEMIGVLRWAIELGRVDLCQEVAMLSSHLANPRLGHLQQAYHVFGYLKQHPKRTLAFDWGYPVIDARKYVTCDWHEFYRDAKEVMPPDMPTPLGEIVSTHCFVDADHAADLATRRSHTGILLFCNKAPILWYSKRQNTVETSTFGSEFVAMRIAVELTIALRYKLRMFGVPLDAPTDFFCDNEAVVKSAQLPQRTLNKKHNAVAYHRVREAVAAGIIRVVKEPTATNLADPLTKALPAVTRNALFDKWMY